MKRERKERSRLSSPHCHPLPFGSPTVRFRLGSLRSPTFTFTSGDRRERRWGGRCGPFPCHSRGPLRTVHRSSLRVVLSPPILVVRPSLRAEPPAGRRLREGNRDTQGGASLLSARGSLPLRSLRSFIVHSPRRDRREPPGGGLGPEGLATSGEVSRAFRFVTGTGTGVVRLVLPLVASLRRRLTSSPSSLPPPRPGRCPVRSGRDDEEREVTNGERQRPNRRDDERNGRRGVRRADVVGHRLSLSLFAPAASLFVHPPCSYRSLRSRSVHVRSHPVPFGHSYPSFAGGGAEPRPGGPKEGVTRGG